MTAVILDASALLAYLLAEPGAERVQTALAQEAIMSSVNLAEVVGHYARLGASRSDIESLLQPLPLEIVTSDAELCFDAGMLRPLTLAGGLSLGDRFCLALAKRRNLPAMTAERRWPLIAEAAGATIEVIR